MMPAAAAKDDSVPEDRITDRYHFIRPDSVVVVLGGINSQGRCFHATGVSRARVVRCWRVNSGDSLGGGHGVFVFPYPDHCCGPGCHELSQERSQRSSMPNTCRNQGPGLSTACGYSSQRPSSPASPAVDETAGLNSGPLPNCPTNADQLKLRPARSPGPDSSCCGWPTASRYGCIRTAAEQLLDLDGHFHLNWVRFSCAPDLLALW
jgi:hypothetical protein